MCCSACEAVFYCSPACQTRDWKEHWKVCGTLTAPGAQTPQQQQVARARSPSPTRQYHDDIDDGDGYEVALPQSNFAHAAAAQAAATSAARDRRLRLRVSAVLAARESRHQDALQSAAEAYEVAQRLGSLYSEGKSMEDEGGISELEGPALVELLIIVRAALAVNDFGTGLGFLEMLTATVDRLAGVGGNPSMLQPSEAASLLYCTSELCTLYNHEERAEDYAHAYLGVVRLAHGEGSKEVGDAHGFLCGLFTRRKRYEEAVLHASSTLKIRQRHASYGAEKPVADAYWNLAVLQYQLGQHRAALDSLEASREIHVRISGEGVATSNVDLALGQVWTILGEAGKAMRAYRQAVRWRQRTLGFAHAETRRAAGLLAAAEIEAHAEEEWRKDVEAEMEEEESAPVPRPRPRQRPREELLSPLGDGGEMMMAQSRHVLRGEPSHQAALPTVETPASSPETQQFSTQSPGTSEGLHVLAPGAASLQPASPSPGSLAPSAQPAGAMKKSGAWGRQSSRTRTGEEEAQNSEVLATVVAGDKDKPLGMTPASAPPGQVFLRTVDKDSWAERSGLQSGMELLTINGTDVKAMSTEEFKTSLKQRPLTLAVGQGKARVSEPVAATVAPATLAASKATSAGESLAMTKLEANAKTEVRPDSSKKTWKSDTQAKDDPKAKADAAANADPKAKVAPAAASKSELSATVTSEAGKLKSSNAEDQLTTLSVPETAKIVGCSFTAAPPGPIFIKLVEAKSWAENAGIKVGWELVAVNDGTCKNMSVDAFKTHMRNRPLSLTLNSKATPSAEQLSKQATNSWQQASTPSIPTSSTPSAKKSPSEEQAKPLPSTKSNTSDDATREEAKAKKAIPRTRKDIINAMFQTSSKDGRLKRKELYGVAVVFGFEDPEEEFEDEYAGLCEEFHCDPKVGFDSATFAKLLEDKEGDYYEDDDKELIVMLQKMQQKR